MLEALQFGDSSPRTRSTAPDESGNYKRRCVRPIIFEIDEKSNEESKQQEVDTC